MAHQPIQFGPADESTPPSLDSSQHQGDYSAAEPLELDLKKDESLTIRWDNGRVSVYPIAYLRRHSPSAEARAVREALAKNPLTVLNSSSKPGASGPITAMGAELVGNYALRIQFSDGHDTGLYTWGYLQEIDPNREDTDDTAINPDEQVKP